MPSICPTVTAFDADEYRTQLDRLTAFAGRVHIDLMDGHFAPTTSPGLDRIWWPPTLTADIHLMYQSPQDCLQALIDLKPSLVIIHVEAQGDHGQFADALHAHGIKAGLALLADTPVATVETVLPQFDHALIFSGHLGFHGGAADLTLLEKAPAIREIAPTIEIGWDGGVNDRNLQQLLDGGIDVLNVGGYIQKATNPSDAYAKLNEEANRS